jgi:hypothetical protein
MSKRERKDSTIAALLEEKPKRGRPRRSVSRQNVYVALSQEQKERMRSLARALPEGVNRADIPDMAINLLSTRLELLRQAVADRNREIPEGITDLDSLYLLWDLPLPSSEQHEEPKWTSIRVSPQQVIELGRVNGVLNAMFGANRSEVFGLGLALFTEFHKKEMADRPYQTVEDVDKLIEDIFL